MSDEKNRMNLKAQVEEAPRAASGGPQPQQGGLPLLGLFAVGFGVLGIFTFAPIFAPLGLILGIIALFIGQIGLGIVAIFLSIVSIVTSPTLIAVVGFGAFLAWFGL